MNIQEEISLRTEKINKIIKEYLPAEEGYQATIFQAMNYSINAGGKRLRPMLMEAVYQLFGGNGDVVKPFMTAIEMIHTYSLVHDDLPAMDNDEYRRGRKTTHVVFGETMGILAGDALLNYAFETATNAFDTDCDPALVGKALKVLSKKSGVYGMVGGQVVDVESEKNSQNEITRDKLDFIYRLKTGALIEGAMMVGAILAGASDEDVAIIEKAGTYLGLAFQIQDDILDVTSTFEVLGKPIGSDEKNDKSTYVTFEGIDKAKRDVEFFSNEACKLLSSLNKDDAFLQQLFLYLIDRQK